jgi:uncharacterized protein YndB with AHSA1/START domain
MDTTEPLVAQTAMLIRRFPLDCYEAFVDPAVTSNFWFTDGSGRLDAADEVTWTWAMYGASSRVDVKELIPGRRILMHWDADTEHESTVEWLFTERADGTTFVDIRNFGFAGDVDQLIKQLIDTVGGFSLVLAGAKAWLEYGLRLNLTEDCHPDRLVEGWRAD